MSTRLNSVWLRREGISTLKSSRQLTVLDERSVVKDTKVVGEVLVERFYPHEGRYRCTWIKEDVLLRDYKVKYQQERFV